MSHFKQMNSCPKDHLMPAPSTISILTLTIHPNLHLTPHILMPRPPPPFPSPRETMKPPPHPLNLPNPLSYPNHPAPSSLSLNLPLNPISLPSHPASPPNTVYVLSLPVGEAQPFTNPPPLGVISLRSCRNWLRAGIGEGEVEMGMRGQGISGIVVPLIFRDGMRGSSYVVHGHNHVLILGKSTNSDFPNQQPPSPLP